MTADDVRAHDTARSTGRRRRPHGPDETDLHPRPTTHRVRELLERAANACADDPSTVSALRLVGSSLERPMTVGLAGSIKSGKSTLLNALAGARVAASDATEC